MPSVLSGHHALGYDSENQLVQRKRPDMDKLRSSQVAKVLGIAPKTLYRMLNDGRISEPARGESNNYREWTREEVQALVKEFGSR